jgi:PTS system nitrogen regulatory IIA component
MKAIMEIVDLLAPNAVLPIFKAQSKKQLLQEMAGHAAQLTGQPERRIFETLIERERLGSTGMGQGIAIPHGRLSGLSKITGVFARLETPIAYDSVDNQPVDLVFLLLAPDGAGADHLKALARVSRLLRNQGTCEKLRAASKPEVLYALLTEPTNGGTSSQAA